MHGIREWSLIVACAIASFGAPALDAKEVQAGSIWNNMDAQNKCPNVCKQNGFERWNGQWHTIPGTVTSVCDCVGEPSRKPSSSHTDWEPAGPLFSQFDAQNKCPGVCQASGREWDGNWKTTEPGRMSVCACKGGGGLRHAGGGGSCSAPAHGDCAGCSAQCASGQRASCQAGVTVNDRFRNGDKSCASAAQCTCR
jgi:hypothetical protein